MSNSLTFKFLVYRCIYLWSHQHNQRLTKWWHYSLNYKLPITISSFELSSGTIPNCLFLIYISICSSSFVLIDVLSYFSTQGVILVSTAQYVMITFRRMLDHPLTRTYLWELFIFKIDHEIFSCNCHPLISVVLQIPLVFSVNMSKKSGGHFWHIP